MGVKLSLKIIGEEEVDAEFGTGAVGVTPAHSHVDAEMGIRNNLEVKKQSNSIGSVLIKGMPEGVTKTAYVDKAREGKRTKDESRAREAKSCLVAGVRRS